MSARLGPGPGSGRTPAEYDDLSRLTPWQVLERTAARLPEKVAVIEGDRRLTYAELLAESARLADGLAGVGPRQR